MDNQTPRKPENPAFVFLMIFCLLAAFSVLALGQRETAEMQRAQAIELIGQNRYIDALPVLEKIMLAYPSDDYLWAHFGIAIIVNATTMTDVDARKEEHARGIKALSRAKQLGTDNVRALDLLDQLENANGVDNFTDENPEVEKALREGEAFFGRGDYDTAFAFYEKAYKLNSKSYEAVLFMGDSRYAQKRYAESETWFAKAAALEANREMAYRFWGDALINQKKYDEARDKFIEALIADPYSRLTWNSLRKWGEAYGNEFLVYEIVPPGGDVAGVLAINDKLLKADDGTVLWKIYKEALSYKPYVAFADETVAWRKLADAVRNDLKAGKIAYPDAGLVNLVRIADEGFLEAYILLLRARENFGGDYVAYREKNREKLRSFIIRRFLNMEK